MNIHIVKWMIPALLILIFTSCGKLIHSVENQITRVNTIAKAGNSVKTNDQNGIRNHKSDELVRILEQELTYQLNDKLYQNTAFLKYNDNQNFSIYLLPEYELTVRDQSKNILSFTENESLYMSIELLSDDVNWNLIKQTTNTLFKSISNEIPIETELKGEYLEGSAKLEVHKDKNVITAYFLNLHNIKLKLTMYTKIDADHRDAFLQMAKTIMKEKARY